MRSKPVIGAFIIVQFIMVAVFLGNFDARAEVPSMISYQGRLTDAAGDPYQGTVELSFALYSDSTAGNQLWKENHASVNVENGLFNVLLGSVDSINVSLFSGGPLWLGIAVDGGDVMMPLTPVVSTGYAFRSMASEQADYATTSGQAAAADTADYAVNARRADTATIALNATGNGWADVGAVVRLSTTTDRVGIGVTSPYEKLEVDGNIKVTSGNDVYFGNDNNRISSSGAVPDNLTLFAQSDLWLRPSADVQIRRGSEAVFARFDLGQRRLGIGTTSADEMLHVENDQAGGIAFIKLQTSHATNFGEVGFRIETPQNRWHFRMDDYTNNNLASGALGLRSQNLGAEVMVWNEDGKVGIGTTDPLYKLDVNGAARANGTFYANNLDISDDAVIGDTLFAGALEANLVNAQNIIDEVGVAGTNSTATQSLTTSFVPYLTREITVPAAGYILAIASAQLWLDHGISGTTWGEMAISDMPNSLNGASSRAFWLYDNVGAGNFGCGISHQRLFYAPSAGTYTYYLIALKSFENSAEIGSREMDLLYIPTAYSSKSGTPEEITEEILSPAAGADEMDQRYNRPDLPSSAANDAATGRGNDELSEEIKALRAEMAEMKSRIEALTKE